MNSTDSPTQNTPQSLINRLIHFSIDKKILVLVAVLITAVWGIFVAPFDWKIGGSLRSPVPVDAIPDIGENQQIVFTEWVGRSPQDIEDQISYPLTVSLLGIPGVKTIRSFSMFGFSTIYIIFEDKIDFYWCRSRILEKLNSLPSDTLPDGVQPQLGPDATAMGQVFWYTLEGKDKEGNPSGGWDLHELRTIQDWYVRFALLSVPGVSEVASVGGFVQEYQVDLDPDLMRIYQVSLNEVIAAVKGSNRDVGAQSIEVNKVEYLIRGIGFIKKLQDIQDAVIRLNEGVPVFVKNVASVVLGPATRQGALDKGGAESVGGVVVVRYGDNPLEVIQKVRQKIAEIAPGLPRKTLSDGTESQVHIVPFYDRTQLIYETLNTLQTALSYEIMITIIVVVVMLFHLRSSLMISGMLPLAVLICFIAMKAFKVDANVVALSGIAIAIGTMVDMGIIITENIARHQKLSDQGERPLTIVLRATREVSGAVATAVSTTIISFLPVFAMEAAEGKLFRPLAFTKTFALLASLIVALFVIPPLAHFYFKTETFNRKYRWLFNEGLLYLGGVLAFLVSWKLGLLFLAIGTLNLALMQLSQKTGKNIKWLANLVAALIVALLLSNLWTPLGPEKGLVSNFLFLALMLGLILGGFQAFHYYYPRLLDWCLAHKKQFLLVPTAMVLAGLMIWWGYLGVFGWMPRVINESRPVKWIAAKFPGLGREFMPPLDEGSYLFMPSTMPHASIGEVLDILKKQDMAIQSLPEVENVVGKLGRAESPLDPAPISMIETLITYKPEYVQSANGKIKRFKYESGETDFFRDINGIPVPAPDGQPYKVQGKFLRDEQGQLIPDQNGGKPYRIWRAPLDPRLNEGRQAWEGIRSPKDIWEAIVNIAAIPGTTSAAKLQPISARMVMLQSGIRSNMGIKVSGPDLATIQNVSLQIEAYLRQVPSVDPRTVIADRIVGKPYLEIRIDRQAIAQYGISFQQVLDVIEFAIGGRKITTTVEGRERYPVRVRYIRELRDDLESLGGILVPVPDGTHIPLQQLADIYYVAGPSVIRGEDTFLVGYVLFDKKTEFAETDVIEEVRDFLDLKIKSGEFTLPNNVSFAFAGTYENQVRSEEKLKVILPMALVIIFVILYLQFNSAATTGLVFSGIAVAWSGGFIMIWLYAQPWFLDFSLFGISLRELFQVQPINLSVAIWVGFLALFGIASDDGVVMTTYLNDTFSRQKPSTTADIRRAVSEASLRRVRPCLMTTATTILALVPVLTSTGRGSDIMVPMAIPVFGGMAFEVITMLVVPVLYCALKEFRHKRRLGSG